MCLNETLLSLKLKPKESMSVCGDLRKNKNCRYFLNLIKKRNEYDNPIDIAPDLLSKPVDAEELINLCKDKKLCPYFLSKFLLKEMRKFLLEYKIGNLSQSPLINSKSVLDTINEISNGNPFIKNGNIKAFSESGPLVLTTGRVSPQKGFEIIFEAIPEVLKAVHNAKFLFLILPTDYSLNEIKSYAHYVKQYPENIRIIFGVASDIFYLAHISADVYCALSRWEPFGIMAL
ncbi:unnamed protein product, partial [marine sediment metagenome]